MEIRFEENTAFLSDEPLIVIQSAALEGESKRLYDTLQHYNGLPTNSIPLKVDDHIVLIRADDIILADIQQTRLLVYCKDGVYQTTEALNHFQRRLGLSKFIQVSKHALINIEHLESLSDSFSGNMTAKLSHGVKTSVSRKYVKSLLTYLGI